MGRGVRPGEVFFAIDHSDLPPAVLQPSPLIVLSQRGLLASPAGKDQNTQLSSHSGTHPFFRSL